MKKFFVIVLALFLLCGCSQTDALEEVVPSESEASSESSSVTEEEKGRFENFFDFSGEKISYVENVTEFTLDYTLGWNLRTEGYVKIENQEEARFGFTQGTAATKYSVTNDLFPVTSAFCTEAEYWFGYPEEQVEFSGVFTYKDDGYGNMIFGFFPYYIEEGENLYLVHERTEKNERLLRELEASLFELTGKEVQPLCLTLSYYDEEGNIIKIDSAEQLEAYTGKELEDDLKYVEAAVYFTSISAWGRNVSPYENIYDTSISGFVEKIEIGEIH